MIRWPRRSHPGRFALVKPVDPDDPAVADVIADWKKIPGTVGIRIMMQCLEVDRAVIGVEKNKPDAIETLRETLPTDLDVSVLPLTVKYPQGAEKMLIECRICPDPWNAASRSQCLINA